MPVHELKDIQIALLSRWQSIEGQYPFNLETSLWICAFETNG
jgi:hypothetical protein